MTVTVTFKCDGCAAVTEGTDWLKRHFKSFTDRDHGLGFYVYDDVFKVVPEGWQAFDRYTGMCYCPDCWASITVEGA